jgi:hypothetical protein
MAISIPIVSEFNAKGIDRAVREFQKLETTGEKTKFALGKMAGPATAALGLITDFASKALTAFMQDDVAAQRLATTLKNTTGATDAQVTAVEKFITQTQKAAAVSDDQLRPALDNLLRGTQDVQTAQDLLNLSLDISAGTGKDLGAVSEALSKAYNGQLGPLKKLDPALGDLIKSGASTQEIFAALSSTFSGQAATAAGTASGQMKSFGIQMDEFKESVGRAIAPILEKLMPAFTAIGDWISNNTGLVVALGVAIGTVAAAIWIGNAAMVAWEAIGAVVAAVNAVMSASFYALWIATGIGIIVAIVAAIVLLLVKFGIMGKIIDGITWFFSKMWAMVKAVIGWIIDHWKLLLVIITGPFGLAIAFILHFKDQIFDIIGKVIGWISDKFGQVLGFITAPFRAAADVIGSILSPFTSVVSGVADAVGDFFGWFGGSDEKKIPDVFAADMKLARQDTDDFKESIKQARLDGMAPAAKEAEKVGAAFEEWIRKPAKNARVEIEKLKTKWDALTGALSMTVAIDTVKQQIEDLADAAALAFASGSQKDIADYHQKLLDTITGLKGITDGLDIVSQKAIKILVDTGDLEGAIALIDLINGNNVLIGKAAMAANASGHGLYIPHMAEGGIVNGPTLAMIGEGNGPEAVIPLSKLGGMGGGGMGGGVTINVNGGISTSNEISQAIVRALQNYVYQSGPVPLNTRAM